MLSDPTQNFWWFNQLLKHCMMIRSHLMTHGDHKHDDSTKIQHNSLCFVIYFHSKMCSPSFFLPQLHVLFRKVDFLLINETVHPARAAECWNLSGRSLFSDNNTIRAKITICFLQVITQKLFTTASWCSTKPNIIWMLNLSLPR